MGHYTELVLDAELSKELPKEICDFFKSQLSDSNEDEDAVVTKDQINFHDFFSTERFDFIGLGDSGYFEAQPRLVFKEIDDGYILNITCSLKNSDKTIEKFLLMIEPYFETDGYIGYLKSEINYNEHTDEWILPRVLIHDNGLKAFYVQKSEEDTELFSDLEANRN